MLDHVYSTLYQPSVTNIYLYHLLSSTLDIHIYSICVYSFATRPANPIAANKRPRFIGFGGPSSYRASQFITAGALSLPSSGEVMDGKELVRDQSMW